MRGFGTGREGGSEACGHPRLYSVPSMLWCQLVPPLPPTPCLSNTSDGNPAGFLSRLEGSEYWAETGTVTNPNGNRLSHLAGKVSVPALEPLGGGGVLCATSSQEQPSSPRGLYSPDFLWEPWRVKSWEVPICSSSLGMFGGFLWMTNEAF